ncbi:MAG: hypothetical protein JO352_07260 [Chloroflexi bacterium]|nr:hypothetical protein [Chloroflexota bacterium]MBV9600914.1 hypothetical protein [Chloroflexota bacterium]
MTDELDELLALWAARQRLTPAQAAEVRANVLASADTAAMLDADRLWALLRPVTDLLEQLGGSRALRYLSPDEDDVVPLTPYLRLA